MKPDRNPSVLVRVQPRIIRSGGGGMVDAAGSTPAAGMKFRFFSSRSNLVRVTISDVLAGTTQMRFKSRRPLHLWGRSSMVEQQRLEISGTKAVGDVNPDTTVPVGWVLPAGTTTGYFC